MIQKAKSRDEASIIKLALEELKSILSDSGALLLIIFAIHIYIAIYSMAYGADVVQDVKICIVDDDHTSLSRTLINGLRSGPNTNVCYEAESLETAKELFYSHNVYGIVYIPQGFERETIGGKQGDISLILDGGHLLLYRQVLEQAAADILELGASIEIESLMSHGDSDVEAVVEPIIYDNHTLYNPSLGYGSFVMPTILIVIIQQTMLIGIAMVRLRRRQRECHTLSMSINITISKILVYTALYAVNSTIILLTVWPIFGFPYNGATLDIMTLLLIYMIAAASLGIAISHLFKRREAPIMLLLWTSVPVLLLAGVSYPREAFPEWLYLLGRLLPSSCAVDSFVAIGTMGATLSDRLTDILTLVVLATGYLTMAGIIEYRTHKVKKS